MSLDCDFFVYSVVQAVHVINDCFLAPVHSPIENSKYFLLLRDDCTTFLFHRILASGDRWNDFDDYFVRIQ
jgi:hypothetical protein